MTRCHVCMAEYEPRNSMRDKTCGHEVCREEWKRQIIRQKAEKEERRKVRSRLEALKPRTQWLKEAQQAFNAWIRWRDRDKPCISCGTTRAAQWDASHYRSTGAAPELRFHPDNVHKACSVCNQHKSGNLIEYRIRLMALIGPTRVEWLEGPHEARHYSIDELKSIKVLYKRLVRESDGL